jgi:hypothetical protein
MDGRNFSLVWLRRMGPLTVAWISGSREVSIPMLAAKARRTWGTRLYHPFGGVSWLPLGEMIFDMDKTREFWLRLGVIVGGLFLVCSALVAFFG